MRQRLKLEGFTFGRLLVDSYAGIGLDGKGYWNCHCRCGKDTQIITASLTRKTRPSRSCGNCYDSLVYPKEYKAYEAMHNRCYCKSDIGYKNYGARGITICQFWRIDFLNFLDDMGIAPSPEHSLDRKDVNGNYEKDNCKWSTAIEQANNTRGNTIYKLGI